MNLPAELFSAPWLWGALLLTLGVVAQVARRAPWREVTEGRRSGVILGFGVLLGLMWSMNAGVQPGLNLHLLGAMAATLALGPYFAVLALAIALTAITLNGAIGWAAWPINFLLMCVVPVAVAYAFQRFIERVLPPNFFIFVFVIAFAGSALAVISGGLTASLAMVAAGAYPFSFLASDYLPYFILLGFSEAWLGGGLISLLVVYKPDWVAAFDDSRYLIGK